MVTTIFSFGIILCFYDRTDSYIGYPDYFHYSYKLKLLFLILSFVVYKMNSKYIERYYKPNVLEISISFNFYIIASLFAISANNFISILISLELQSLCLISLVFVITFGLTSGRPKPTLVEAAAKFF